jgi:lambda family phage portal protein
MLGPASAARPQTPPPAARRVRASYDAAQTSSDTDRWWANSDRLSVNSANILGVRQRLRWRARYEVANNSYARGIVNTLANDTVGTGPRLQLLTPNVAANRQIEHAFAQWSNAVGFAEKLRLLRTAKCQDGEAFGLLASNPKLPSPVQLDLRLVECDQVSTPEQNYSTAALDGIELDDYGNPTYYHLLHVHPGDIFQWITPNGGGLYPFLNIGFDRIPARLMVHWFRSDRPGQARGIPELTSCLQLFAQLRRYTLAVIRAAEVAADFSALLESPAPADTGADADDPTPFESLEIERGMLTTLPGGSKLAQLKAEQPTTTYGDFKHEILNEIARCLNVPFNVAAGNSSKYNYASGRLDHQTYYKSLKVERDHCERVVLDHVFGAWLDEAALVPGLLPEGLGPYGDWPHQWFWDGQEHVDPAKEAIAQAMRLANHTTTYAQEYARQGQDWEEALRQRAKEIELMESLGLPLPNEPGNAVTPGTPTGAPDADPEDAGPEEEETTVGND